MNVPLVLFPVPSTFLPSGGRSRAPPLLRQRLRWGPTWRRQRRCAVGGEWMRGFFGGSGGVGGAKQIFLCNQRRTVARTVGGALLTYDDRRADWLATDTRTEDGPSFLPSLPPSLNLPSAAAGCPAGLAQSGPPRVTTPHRWSTTPPPRRGCGSTTVALLRCRLQTNLSPTNHDLPYLPLNLGVGNLKYSSFLDGNNVGKS